MIHDKIEMGIGVALIVAGVWNIYYDAHTQSPKIGLCDKPVVTVIGTSDSSRANVRVLRSDTCPGEEGEQPRWVAHSTVIKRPWWTPDELGPSQMFCWPRTDGAKGQECWVEEGDERTALEVYDEQGLVRVVSKDKVGPKKVPEMVIFSRWADGFPKHYWKESLDEEGRRDGVQAVGDKYGDPVACVYEHGQRVHGCDGMDAI